MCLVCRKHTLLKRGTYGHEPRPSTIPNPSLIAFLQISLEFLSAKGIKSRIRCAQPSTFKSVRLKKGEYREDIVDLQLYLTKMDIEEEKNPQENFAHLQSSQNVKMMKTLPGRACLLFIFHSQSQKNSWCSIIDCQLKSVF